MSKCKENQASSKQIPISPKSRTKRECCCIKEYNQLKNNLKTLQAISQSAVDKPSKTKKLVNPESNKSNLGQQTNLGRNNAKTWFEVLRESPKKEIQRKPQSQTTNGKYLRLLDRADLLKNVDPEGLTLLLDDEKFLKKLIQMNEAIQSYIRNNARPHHDTAITDDDKFKSYLGMKSREESQEQQEKQNLQAKALVKLLENMQSVSNNTEIQRETLDNLTHLVVQLREENKMLDKLKEVRIDLESKLSSLSTENLFLKKQLHVAETERNRANRSLDAKEKEIQMLKKRITAVKGKIASKIDSGIKYDLDDASIELNYLDDTIASVPSNNQSFDAPIRPASSSPTEEILQKWKTKSSAGRADEDSGIQSNPQDHNSPINNDKSEITHDRQQILSHLKNNVKRTVEELQSGMKFSDVSLNLSDVTYKLNSSLVL